MLYIVLTSSAWYCIAMSCLWATVAMCLCYLWALASWFWCSRVRDAISSANSPCEAGPTCCGCKCSDSDVGGGSVGGPYPSPLTCEVAPSHTLKREMTWWSMTNMVGKAISSGPQWIPALLYNRVIKDGCRSPIEVALLIAFRMDSWMRTPISTSRPVIMVNNRIVLSLVMLLRWWVGIILAHTKLNHAFP